MKGWKKLAILGALLLAVAALLIAKQSRPAAREVQEREALPRLLELGANKCTNCKMMVPILADLKRMTKGRLHVDFIDVWEDESAGEKYEARIIPLQIFFDAQGQELFRHVGFYAKEDILAKWQELGYEFQ